jgi:DNA polymerase-3 subunit gamma/tau
MPDPDRPSSAPLSEADADRLSERFTASWDEPTWEDAPTAVAKAPTAPAPPAPTPAGPPAALTSPATVTAKLPAVTLPLPTPAAAPSPNNPPLTKPKQTLLGIAPILPVGPSPAAAAPVAAAPATAAATLAAASAAPPPELSSSPIATAVTTPSKPYVPKDHPSTPAVVISGEALAVDGFVKEDRSRTAQTMPGQTRGNPVSAPAAALVPGTLPAPSPQVAPASSTLDDTYPPARRRGSKVPLVIGGLALLGAVGVVGLKLSASSSTEAEPAAATDQPALAAPIDPPKATATAAPTEAPPPPAPSEPVATADTRPEPAAAAPEPVPAARKSKTKKAAAPAPAAKRPAAARPEPKSDARPTPASEPAAATPAPKPAKGVIVRETPF